MRCFFDAPGVTREETYRSFSGYGTDVEAARSGTVATPSSVGGVSSVLFHDERSAWPIVLFHDKIQHVDSTTKSKEFFCFEESRLQEDERISLVLEPRAPGNNNGVPPVGLLASPSDALWQAARSLLHCQALFPQTPGSRFADAYFSPHRLRITRFAPFSDPSTLTFLREDANPKPHEPAYAEQALLYAYEKARSYIFNQHFMRMVLGRLTMSPSDYAQAVAMENVAQSIADINTKVNAMQLDFAEFSKILSGGNNERIFQQVLNRRRVTDLKNRIRVKTEMGLKVLRTLDEIALVTDFRELCLEILGSSTTSGGGSFPGSSTSGEEGYLRQLFRYVRFKYDTVHLKRDFRDEKDRAHSDFRTPGDLVLELVAVRGQFLELMAILQDALRVLLLKARLYYGRERSPTGRSRNLRRFWIVRSGRG